MQVRQDLSSGRLVSPLSTVCLLSSYAVQSTLGDYDLDSCRPGYLANFAALRHHCKEIVANHGPWDFYQCSGSMTASD